MTRAARESIPDEETAIMCARIFYLLLAAMFTFIVATVAAFNYLEWWQAILASAFAFVVIVAVVKAVLMSMIRNLGKAAQGLFEVNSKVLRDASVDVHSIRIATTPEDVIRLYIQPEMDEADREEAKAELENLRWYEIEVTIFPDPSQAGPMQHWDFDDLFFIPAKGRDRKLFPRADDNNADDMNKFPIYQVEMVIEGVADIPSETEVTGPQRLRLTTGIRKDIHEVKFWYHAEQFGRIVLPSASGPALPGR